MIDRECGRWNKSWKYISLTQKKYPITTYQNQRAERESFPTIFAPRQWKLPFVIDDVDIASIHQAPLWESNLFHQSQGLIHNSCRSALPPTVSMWHRSICQWHPWLLMNDWSVGHLTTVVFHIFHRGLSDKLINCGIMEQPLGPNLFVGHHPRIIHCCSMTIVFSSILFNTSGFGSPPKLVGFIEYLKY